MSITVDLYATSDGYPLHGIHVATVDRVGGAA